MATTATTTEPGAGGRSRGTAARAHVQRFGTFLSGMIMPNIGAFIAWGLITAFFIEAGFTPYGPLGGFGTDAEGMPIDETSAMIDFRADRFELSLPGPAPLIPMGELGVMPGPIPDLPPASAARNGPPGAAPSHEGALPAPHGRRGGGRARRGYCATTTALVSAAPPAVSRSV